MVGRGVSQEVIAEVAETVIEKIDILLERAADSVLGTPKPGSSQWRQEWEARDTATGRAALELRARVKIAIAEAAGVDPHHEIERVSRAGVLTPHVVTVEQGERTSRPSGRRRRPAAGSEQLAIW